MTFLIRPPPLLGESLSSWRQRSGQANGFFWFPRLKSRSAKDPDLLPCAEELGWLSREFSQPESAISALSLGRYCSLSVGEPVGAQFLRWTLGYTGLLDRGDSVSNYCPLCLQSDNVPYFRLIWRFAFISHCPIHHCRLLTACPGCHRNCWPASYSERNRYIQRWADIHHCPDCGSNLGQAIPEIDGNHQSSWRLFRMLDTRARGSTDLPFPTEDYFRALWSTSRIISRKIDRFVGAGNLQELRQVRDQHVKSWTIERQPREVRQAIISSAEYLLAGWPDRFVQACEQAQVSRTDFGGRDGCSPEWFDDVVKHQLAKAVNWITREDVSTAVAEIEATGLPVSKNALRRKLGITESWAINEILDQRREATCAELASLCQHYHYLIGHTPPSRDQQRTLCRDFLILLVSASSGQSVEKVCRMTESEIAPYVLATRNTTNTPPEIDTIFNTLSELFDHYRAGIRSVFALRATESVPYWFLTRFGKAMDGHSVRERFARLMKNLFEPKLWNSMDVFLRTLSGQRKA